MTPFASGRAAEVFDLGDGNVLRRYREPGHDVELERRVMQYACDQGVPVPRLGLLGADHDPSRDIVMERIDGPTMLDDLTARPWKLLSHARLLARLQHRIHEVEAPEWMLAPGASAISVTPPRLLHLDLHPMNVLLSPSGAVVIDWTNAAGGPAGFDAAHSVVEMSTFETASTRDRWAQRMFVAAFRRASGARDIDAYMAVACDHRLADTGLTPGERVAVAGLRQSVVHRRSGRPA